MLIAVANGKGGVGKTTTCLALSALFLEQGKRVLGIDADPQGSFSQNVAGYKGLEIAQETNPALLKKLKQLKGYDVILCDTPPALRDEGLQVTLEVADFVIMPSRYDKLDLDALVETIRVAVLPTKTPYRVLLTQVDSKRIAYGLQVQSWLMSQGARVFSGIVRQYAAYSAALLQQVPITQLDYKNVGEAAGDYRRVYDELIREIGNG